MTVSCTLPSFLLLPLPSSSSLQELLPAVHVECSYWDLSLDEGFGGWSTEGCSRVVRVEDDAGKVVCDCNHLTNFAVLLVGQQT